MFRFLSCFMAIGCGSSGSSVDGRSAGIPEAEADRFRNVRPSTGRSASAGISQAESFRTAPGMRPSAQKSRTRRGVMPYSSANSCTVLYASSFISARKDRSGPAGCQEAFPAETGTGRKHCRVRSLLLPLPWPSKRLKTEMRYQGKQLKIFQFSLISQVGAEGLGNTEGLRKDGRPEYLHFLLAEIRTEWASGGEGIAALRARKECSVGAGRGAAFVRRFPATANRDADTGPRRVLFMA